MSTYGFLLAALSVAAGFAQVQNQLREDVPTGLQQKPRAEPPSNVTEETRGDIFMARKMYREALDSYMKAPQESAVIANKVGIAYHQLLQLDRAKKNYERAVKLNPKYAEALNNIGTVHYAKKSYRRSISFYRRALKLAPNSASVYSNLGTAYFARKKYEDAAICYQKALQLDADVFEHRSSAGVLLQERSVDERAKFYFYLAKSYAKAGQTDRVLQYMRKAIEEGFKERKRFAEDPEFASMQELPAFQELLAYQPRVL
jgi:tetratricopeptide (TPR) repeat protein